MQTVAIPNDFQHQSPAGAEVRLLLNNQYGGMAHCTLPNQVISKAVRHKTVSEFWHILSGKGQIWRRSDNNEIVTDLNAGVSIDIPLGTDFQYRSNDGDLVFICITNPPWPGHDEVSFVSDAKWQPTDLSQKEHQNNFVC